MPVGIRKQVFDQGIVGGVRTRCQLAALPGRECFGGVRAERAGGAVAMVASLEDADDVMRVLAELHRQLGVQHHLTLVAPAMHDEQAVQAQHQSVQHERTKVAAEKRMVAEIDEASLEDRREWILLMSSRVTARSLSPSKTGSRDCSRS